MWNYFKIEKPIEKFEIFEKKIRASLNVEITLAKARNDLNIPTCHNSNSMN